MSRSTQNTTPLNPQPKRRRRPVTLPKALHEFFFQDFENWMSAYLGTSPDKSKLHKFKMTLRYQMDAMHIAKHFCFILTLPTAKEDDKFIRDWAISAGAGMGYSGKQYSTYELLRGPMDVIAYAVRDTKTLGMDDYNSFEKSDESVMDCLREMDWKLKNRYDIEGIWAQ